MRFVFEFACVFLFSEYEPRNGWNLIIEIEPFPSWKAPNAPFPTLDINPIWFFCQNHHHHIVSSYWNDISIWWTYLTFMMCLVGGMNKQLGYNHQISAWINTHYCFMFMTVLMKVPLVMSGKRAQFALKILGAEHASLVSISQLRISSFDVGGLHLMTSSHFNKNVNSPSRCQSHGWIQNIGPYVIGSMPPSEILLNSYCSRSQSSAKMTKWWGNRWEEQEGTFIFAVQVEETRVSFGEERQLLEVGENDWYVTPSFENTRSKGSTSNHTKYLANIVLAVPLRRGHQRNRTYVYTLYCNCLWRRIHLTRLNMTGNHPSMVRRASLRRHSHPHSFVLFRGAVLVH